MASATSARAAADLGPATVLPLSTLAFTGLGSTLWSNAFVAVPVSRSSEWLSFLQGVSLPLASPGRRPRAARGVARHRPVTTLVAVVDEERLFSALGSGSFPVTDALFSTTVRSSGAVPVRVIVRCAPAASGPPAHST